MGRQVVAYANCTLLRLALHRTHHASAFRTAWSGRRKRPPATSTPPPPLREEQVRIGDASGLSINLPLRGPWPCGPGSRKGRVARPAPGTRKGQARPAPGTRKGRVARPPRPWHPQGPGAPRPWHPQGVPLHLTLIAGARSNSVLFGNVHWPWQRSLVVFPVFRV
jgi:hypothetical protein